MPNFEEIRLIVVIKSKKYRKEKNHSQEQAEDACGLNFSRMENAKHDPRLTSLIVLANYGSRTMDQLLDRDE